MLSLTQCEVPLSVFHLQDNWVQNIHGNWVTSGGAWSENLWFNCYAFAIGYTEPLPHTPDRRPHQPGDFSGAPFTFWNQSIGEIADVVRQDLEFLGYHVNVTFDEPSNLSPHQTLIVIRRGPFDYHLMRWNQETNFWYHKPGSTQILRYRHHPDYKIWGSEQSYRGVESPGIFYYDSDTYYITFWEAPLIFERIGNTVNARVRMAPGSNFAGEITIPFSTLSNGMSLMVTEIAANGFQGFLGSSVVIPNTVTTIRNNAFPIATTVIWENNFKFRGNTFLQYLRLSASFTIPSSVGGRVINRIGYEAFANNLYIRNLTIPDTITNIENRAFANATNLRGIINLTSTPQVINNTTFQGVNTSRIMLGVSQNMTQAFINAGWRNFIIIEQHLFSIIIMPNGDIEFLFLDKINEQYV